SALPARCRRWVLVRSWFKAPGAAFALGRIPSLRVARCYVNPVLAPRHHWRFQHAALAKMDAERTMRSRQGLDQTQGRWPATCPLIPPAHPARAPWVARVCAGRAQVDHTPALAAYVVQPQF